MASLVFNPRPTIYKPPIMIYGFTQVNNGKTLISDLKRLIEDLNDQLNQAYDLYTKVKLFKKNSCNIIGSITSLEGCIEPGCHDRRLWPKSKEKLLLNKLLSKGFESGILIDEKNNGFHYIQILPEVFNPESTMTFILGIELTTLTLAGEKTSETKVFIDEGYLKNRIQIPIYNYFI